MYGLVVPGTRTNLFSLIPVVHKRHALKRVGFNLGADIRPVRLQRGVTVPMSIARMATCASAACEESATVPNSHPLSTCANVATRTAIKAKYKSDKVLRCSL